MTVNIAKRLKPFNGAWCSFGDSITAQLNSYAETAVKIAGQDFVGKFGYSGYRSDQIIQYIPQVLASGASKCVLQIGTNDASSLVPVSDFYDNLVLLYKGLQQGGMTVESVYISPDDTLLGNVFKYNIAIYKASKACGVRAHSVWDGMANADGSWKTNYDLDGRHPSKLAVSIASKKLADQILQNSFDLPRPYSAGSGLVLNPTFSGVGTIADGWYAFNGTDFTPSLVSAENGNYQKLSVIYNNRQTGVCSGFVYFIGGHRYLITGKASVNTFGLNIKVWANMGNEEETQAEQLVGLDSLYVSDEVRFLEEAIAPAYAVKGRVFCTTEIEGATGSGILQFSEIEIVDLTALGLT